LSPLNGDRADSGREGTPLLPKDDDALIARHIVSTTLESYHPRTALVGLFLAVVVVLTKSLWPAILIHAAIDFSSGELGFAISRAASEESAGIWESEQGFSV